MTWKKPLRGWACTVNTGSATFSLAESQTGTIALINLGTKPAGKRGAGIPHAAFDEAGAGNRAQDTAPALDPTGGGRGRELTFPSYPYRY